MWNFLCPCQHLCVNLFHLMDALDLEGVPDLEVSSEPELVGSWTCSQASCSKHRGPGVPLKCTRDGPVATICYPDAGITVVQAKRDPWCDWTPASGRDWLDQCCCLGLHLGCQQPGLQTAGGGYHGHRAGLRCTVRPQGVLSTLAGTSAHLQDRHNEELWGPGPGCASLRGQALDVIEIVAA